MENYPIVNAGLRGFQTPNGAETWKWNWETSLEKVGGSRSAWLACHWEWKVDIARTNTKAKSRNCRWVRIRNTCQAWISSLTPTWASKVKLRTCSKIEC